MFMCYALVINRFSSTVCLCAYKMNSVQNNGVTELFE